MSEKPRHWVGDVGPKDDFGDAIHEVFYDAKTDHGPWAIMTPKSWRAYGCGRVGMGFGQVYKKQADGRWLKIGG